MAQVYNVDTATIVEYIDRVDEELYYSQSAKLPNGCKDADKMRLKFYLDELRKLIAHMKKDPELDLPESDPTIITVPDYVEKPRVNNISTNYIRHLIKLLRVEILNSQSARDSSNIHDPDFKIIDNILSKLENFLSEYIDKCLQGHWPESSPGQPISGAGKLGT